MVGTVVLLSLIAQVQTSSATDPAHRTSAALERIAEAAQKAADAATRAAVAAEKVAGIPPPAPAGAAAAAPAPEPSPWSGTVGFGLIWLAGNSKTITFSGNAAVQMKSEHWIFGAKVNGVYGESTVRVDMMDTNQVTALAAGLQLRGDRRFTERVTGYVLGGIETDHVKSIEWRAIAEAGSGITWLETIEGDLTKLSLRTDLAFRYAKENRYQYYPSDMEMDLEDTKLVAPKLGLAFRYALSKDLIFTEDAEILPNVIDLEKDFRYLLNSTSKLSVKLTSVLSFAVALDVKHDSLPAPGKESTDSALTIGLEVGL